MKSGCLIILILSSYFQLFRCSKKASEVVNNLDTVVMNSLVITKLDSSALNEFIAALLAAKEAKKSSDNVKILVITDEDKQKLLPLINWSDFGLNECDLIFYKGFMLDLLEMDLKRQIQMFGQIDKIYFDTFCEELSDTFLMTNCYSYFSFVDFEKPSILDDFVSSENSSLLRFISENSIILMIRTFPFSVKVFPLLMFYHFYKRNLKFGKEMFYPPKFHFFGNYEENTGFYQGSQGLGFFDLQKHDLETNFRDSNLDLIFKQDYFLNSKKFIIYNEKDYYGDFEEYILQNVYEEVVFIGNFIPKIKNCRNFYEIRAEGRIELLNSGKGLHDVYFYNLFVEGWNLNDLIQVFARSEKVCSVQGEIMLSLAREYEKLLLPQASDLLLISDLCSLITYYHLKYLVCNWWNIHSLYAFANLRLLKENSLFWHQIKENFNNENVIRKLLENEMVW